MLSNIQKNVVVNKARKKNVEDNNIEKQKFGKIKFKKPISRKISISKAKIPKK
jgi:hypothetical protein